MSIGGGSFFGGGMGGLDPRGPYGAWPGCGCSSAILILAGMLLICSGCLRSFGF
jgi:hypothetical protein